MLSFKLEDEIPECDVSVVEINNIIVNFRKIVKKTKKINKLIKKCPEKDKTRAEKLRNEENYLRHIEIGRLAKLLLCHGHFESNNNSQTNIMNRFLEVNEIKQYIDTKFKTLENYDQVVKFLLYKNISGKFKNRKQKRKNAHKTGLIPIPKQHESIKKLIPEGETARTQLIVPEDKNSAHKDSSLPTQNARSSKGKKMNTVQKSSGPIVAKRPEVEDDIFGSDHISFKKEKKEFKKENKVDTLLQKRIEENLHPSWTAKMKEKQVLNTIKFENPNSSSKRIVFS